MFLPSTVLRSLQRLAGLLAAALPALAAAAGPPGHVPVRSYGPAQGLPDVSIRALLQDRAGFIWAAAEEKLYRYDAHRFEGYGGDDGLDAVPTALAEDAAGRLWVGTRSGLFRRDGERFTAAPGSEAVDVVALAAAGDTLWVAGTRGPLQLDGNGRLQALPGWPGDAASAVLADPAGTLWVARWSGRAEIWRWQAGRWQPAPLPEDARAARIGGLARDAQGRIWARQPAALLVADTADATAAFRIAPLASGIAAQLRSTRPVLLAGRRGEIWAPGDAGLLRHADGAWQGLDVAGSLPTAWTRTVLEDREGNLWTGSRGLHRLRLDSPFRSYAGRDGVDGNAAWSLLRDGGRLWLAGDGLAELDAAGLHPVEDTRTHRLLSLTRCGDGRLYAAGLPGDAVLAVDPARGATQRLALGALASARVLRVHCDRAGTLWAATEDQGLLRADDPSRAAFAREALPGGGADEVVGDVVEDTAGRLWVAGRHGLAVRDDGVWRRYGQRDGLRRDAVAYLAATRAGSLLVGYFGSYAAAEVALDGERLRVRRHLDPPAANGADAVYLLGEDAQGRIWLGGNRGVDLLEADGWRHYGSADGLVGEDLNRMAFLAEADGDVWLGTSAGLARFDAAAARRAPQAAPPPPVTVTGFRLAGVAADPATVSVAPAGTHRAEFRYAALNYADEEFREYRSRLLGHDAEFRIGGGHEQSYAGLGAGRFRFEVAARRRGGDWGPDSIVEFSIPPPWWQTGWLRGLALLAAAALILLGLRWRLARLAAQNRALEARVQARTSELHASNAALRNEIGTRVAAERALSTLSAQQARDAAVRDERRRVAHDLHDNLIQVLSSISLQAQTLAHVSATQAGEDLPQRSARVAELAQLAVGDLRGLLQELRTPEAAAGNLDDEAIPLVDAVNRLLRLMVPTTLATTCDFAAYVQQQPEQEQALLRIVQEAVSNAVRHAAAARLQVSADVSAGQVVVRIADDGRGLPRRRRRGAGLGLESMRARAQALGGRLKARRGDDGGTCIEVRLPRRDRETGA